MHDLATELIVGKIMYKFDKQCKLYILGQGSTYLFIIFYTFFKLCGCQCISDLKFEEYWEECEQLSDTRYCERFEPRSHFKRRLSLIVRVKVVTVNINSLIQDYVQPDDQTQPTHVIVHTTLILICLLRDAFLDIASFRPRHE